MQRLGEVIAEAICIHYSRQEFLRRLAHPYWFQSFGAVMGMDWHSSGITTSVMSALKRGLLKRCDLGLYVCGGRGKQSRKTPNELTQVGYKTGLDGNALAQTSRLVAKVDSAAVQDGFDLYLHSFVVSLEGEWTVVQQGMNPSSRTARRYHWLSEQVASFVDDPHHAIEGPNIGTIINLADARADHNRAGQVELVRDHPEKVTETLRVLRDTPHLHMPSHHDVKASDVVLRRLERTLMAATTNGPQDFRDLLLTPGVGTRTVRALTLVSEVIHGAPARFSDPARFSVAHGGKDGHPFPVPLKVYDETIRVLKSAVTKARLGSDDKLSAIRRLDDQARRVDAADSAANTRLNWNQFVASERQTSPKLDGRTTARPRAPIAPHRQLSLFETS